MEAEKVYNLKKIINQITENKNKEFSFKSCLFVLNRCDEVEINIEESKKEYERIFQINSNEKTLMEMVDISNNIKDLDNINITKFSNTLYSDFKSFVNKIKDFDNYLKDYEIKNDKKYEGKKYLMFLKKKVYEDVCLISSEKYKSFKNNNKQIDITKYQNHFKLFLKEEENKNIISDIIKMYLFIKDSFYELKFYEKSNAKDFFEKLNNQILVSKLFSEESLKKVVFNCFEKTNFSFQFINNFIINNRKSGLNFEKKDFINAQKNLNEKNQKYKIIFEEEINYKFQLMENEYDNLIKNFNDGNFTSYKTSIEETVNKINIIKEELKNNINEKFRKFTEEIMQELKFITKRLQELEIQNEKNANNINMFKSVNEAEKETFKIAGKVLITPIVLPLAMLFHEDKYVSCMGLGLIMSEIGCCSLITPFAAAVTGGVLVAAAGAIHLGFSLYKNQTEKGKYIELIEKAKNELKNSCSNVKNKIYQNCETNKNQIKSAVKNFEQIIFSKNEGIKKNKKECLALFNKLFKFIIILLFFIYIIYYN